MFRRFEVLDKPRTIVRARCKPLFDDSFTYHTCLHVFWLGMVRGGYQVGSPGLGICHFAPLPIRDCMARATLTANSPSHLVLFLLLFFSSSSSPKQIGSKLRQATPSPPSDRHGLEAEPGGANVLDDGTGIGNGDLLATDQLLLRCVFFMPLFAAWLVSWDPSRPGPTGTWLGEGAAVFDLHSS